MSRVARGINPEDPRIPRLIAFDSRIDRIAERLWGRKPRRHVLLVFMLGRGDLMLFSNVIDRLRALLEPGERLEILLRSGVAGAAFVLPPDIPITSIAADRFLKHRRYRLFWSLRLARRRYRRAIVFDTNFSPWRDERLGRLAAGDDVDVSISFPENYAPDNDLQRLIPPERRVLNEGHAHTLDFWAACADRLTGAENPPPLPRFAPERLAAPRRGVRPHVVLHPFPSFSSKFFRPELYRPLLEALGASHDVLVSTGPKDLDIYKRMRVLGELPHVRFVRAPLDATTGWVRGADLVISVDTALAHLGIGCGTPTLVLHNTDDPGVYIPYPRPADVPHAHFLAIPHDPEKRRQGWQPRRIWEFAPGMEDEVRRAGLALLARGGTD